MIAGTNEHDTIEYDMKSFRQYPQCQEACTYSMAVAIENQQNYIVSCLHYFVLYRLLSFDFVKFYVIINNK